jgi:hypothetical protein
VKKVYSINILYFDLGKGAEYLYHGQTTLIGVHTKDTLQLAQHEQDDLHVVTSEDVFPEYFVVHVNEFNQLAVTPLNLNFNLFCNDNACLRIFAWSATLPANLS